MSKLSSDIDSRLSDTVIEQLQRKHISTVLQFVIEDSEKLATFTKITLKDILDLKQILFKKYGGITKNTWDLFQIERNNIIPTDLSSLDNLLKGGLYPGQIYEICGISSSGKTQLCLTIASNVALKPNNIVRYIDTKRDFCGTRIGQILLGKNCDKQLVDEIMGHIKVCQIRNLRQLFKVLNWLTIVLKEEKEEYRTRIIIIDCLPALIFKFAKDHEKTTTLNHLANICRFIANEFRLSILIVNLITQWNVDNDKGSTSKNPNVNLSNSVTPTLGKYWTHVPNTRLLIEKLDITNRKVSVWKSFQLEANISCTFNISDYGVLCD